MNNAGYIKLPRKIREWVWYKKPNTRAVFLHILLGASWEDETVRGFKLKRGQFLTTVPELATENQLSVQQVKTALAHLKSTHDITVDVTSKISIITVCNYDDILNGSFDSNGISADTSNGYQFEKAQDNNRSSLLENNTRIEEAKEIREESGEPPQAKPIVTYQQATSYLPVRSGESVSAAADNISDLVASVVGKYNAICKSLPDIAPDVAVQQKAELIKSAQAVMGSATFEQLFTLVEQSDFLTKRSSDSSFKAYFEWILKPDNLAKILSGAYSENYSKTEKKATVAPGNVPSAADYGGSLYD